MVSAEVLERDLEMLQHGGVEAVSLFMEMSEKLYERGGPDMLDCWVTIAAPRLPEAERNAVLSLLVRTVFAGYRRGERTHDSTVH
jgi:hypothetical protein